jgi:hypothetical protein
MPSILRTDLTYGVTSNQLAIRPFHIITSDRDNNSASAITADEGLVQDDEPTSSSTDTHEK